MAEPSRILVLGGGGRVGRLLRHVWRQDDRAPEVVFQARSPGPGIDVVCDPSFGLGALIDGLGGFRADLVLSLWGVTPHSRQTELRDNTRLAGLAIEIARRTMTPRAVFASTGAVYAASDSVHREEDAEQPQSPYGQAKRSMEAAILAQSRTNSALGNQPSLTILRMANVVGADMLADVVLQSTPSRPLRLDRFADGGGPCRSYLSPVTLARTIEAVARAAPHEPEVLNLADGPQAWDMAEMLRALGRAGREVAWTWRDAPRGAIEMHRLDVSRLTALYPGVASEFRTSPDALVEDWSEPPEAAS